MSDQPFAAPAAVSVLPISADRAPYTGAEVMKSHRLFMWFFLIGIGVYLASGLGMLAVMPDWMRNQDELQRLGPEAMQQRISGDMGGLILVGVMALVSFIGSGLLVTGIVFQMILHYRCWTLVSLDEPRTTPGKAVGYLFIPLYNLYWLFPSFGGLATDQAKAMQRRGLTPPAPATAIIVLLVLVFLLSLGLAIVHAVTSQFWLQYVQMLTMLPMAVLMVIYHRRYSAAAAEIADHWVPTRS
jgi:hypothetical protein